jgi:DNA-binding transcriptional LysR family regulator
MNQDRRTDYLIDAHLLRVFCTVVSERSVSRAAHLLHQSQPAVSATLGKLRQLLGDPLLVRGKSGMVPTERATQLLANAQRALVEIDQMVTTPAQFDPASSQHLFKIGAPDYVAPSFMASVIQRLRKQAPHTHIEIQSLGPMFDLEHSLSEATLDLVIGNWPEPPAGMFISKLMEEDIVCLVSQDHPLADKDMRLEEYLHCPHVVPMPYSLGQKGVIDQTLSGLKLRRNQQIQVQSFSLAPYLLTGTDLIFTTTRHFASHYCQMLNLSIIKPPVQFPPMRFYQLWHERHHPSPAHRWLRKLLLDCAQSFQANGATEP